MSCRIRSAGRGPESAGLKPHGDTLRPFVSPARPRPSFAARHFAGDEKVIISEGFRSAKLIRNVDGSWRVINSAWMMDGWERAAARHFLCEWLEKQWAQLKSRRGEWDRKRLYNHSAAFGQVRTDYLTLRENKSFGPRRKFQLDEKHAANISSSTCRDNKPVLKSI